MWQNYNGNGNGNGFSFRGGDWQNRFSLFIQEQLNSFMNIDFIGV